jgi:hypothetical protein
MKSTIRISLLTLLCIFINHSLNAQLPANPWSKWDYLIGEWIGDGKGDPGEAKGWFSLKTNLDKNILVRTNHAEFPATNDRPAAVHDDLIIVYAGTSGNSAKAIYFDNEKHVINYSVSYGDVDNAIILTSEAQENAPRFRFTYKRIDEEKIKTIFEIAPPGKPDSFSVYIEGTAHKKN